jgi:hypothetical protein
MSITYDKITQNINAKFYTTQYWTEIDATLEDNKIVKQEAEEEFWQHCHLASGLSETLHKLCVDQITQTANFKNLDHTSKLGWYKFGADLLRKVGQSP